MIRRPPHEALGHAERGPDVLLYVDGPRIAAQRLDHARQIDEGRVAVAEPGARAEAELLVRHHRDELIPARGLERLPGTALAVGPGGVLEARAVGEEHAEGDVVDGAEPVVHLPELGHVPHDGVVEREAAPITQLQDGDGGERLGDGGPVVHRVLRGCARDPQVATAIGVTRQHAAGTEDHHTSADDAIRPGIAVERRSEGGPPGRRPREGGRAGLRGRAACARERDRGGENAGRAEGPKHAPRGPPRLRRGRRPPRR